MKGLIAASAVALAMSGMYVEQPANAYERWLRINNYSSVSICEVYISHVDDNDWGPDLLGRYCIEPGQTMTVDPGWQYGYCMMDIMLVTRYEEITDVINICELTDYNLRD